MRPTRSSITLKDARRRLERLKAIQPLPNIGEGFNFETYETAVENLAKLEAEYNTTISGLDAKLVVIKEKEMEIRDYRSRILAAVGVKYGKDSDEYVAAGGTKTSERKRTYMRRSTSLPMSTD